jgi:flagellar motor switch protein FliM
MRPLLDKMTELAPRVGLRLSVVASRKLVSTCSSVSRLAAADLAGPPTWFPMELGLHAAGAVVIGDSTAVPLADFLMGGLGDFDNRPPTPLEQAVLRRHLQSALQGLVEGLTDYGITHLRLREAPMFSDPEDIIASLGGADVVVVRVDVEVDGAVLDGGIAVALPALEMLGHDAGGDEQTARAALAAVPLTISVRFPSTLVTAADMRSLEVGDVLRLDATSPAVLGLVGDGADRDGFCLLRGGLGRRGRKRAIVVTALEDKL